MYRLIKLSILWLLPGIVGAITVNCGATSPASPKSVTCSCKNVGGTGVEWWEDTTDRSHCIFSHQCLPNPIGYTFSMNQTEQTSIMTVNPYNYGICQQFTCKDFSDTSIQQSQTPSTIDFDSTMPSVIAEPVLNNTSGDISITTSCISGYLDLIAEWYIVVNGTKKQYIPNKDIVIRQVNTTACIACNNESAATIKLGLKHKEAVDNEASEGHIQLELHHSDYPSDKLVRKTTNVYKVADFDENGECNWCPKFCLQESEGACIIIIVIVVVVAIVVVVVVAVICNRYKVKGEKKWDTTSEKSASDKESGIYSIESFVLQEGNTTLASDDKSETKSLLQNPQNITSESSC